MRLAKEVAVRNRGLVGGAILALILSMLLAGCAGSGPVRTESQETELGAADSVRVELTMGAGALVVDGGAEELLEARFTYSQESWRPEVEYTVTGREGLLVVKQPAGLGSVTSPNVSYEWDLRFNSEVPMEMKVSLGAGGGDLDLGELNLSRLELEVGVGGTDIDLAGDYQRDLEATIDGGIGGIALALPRDVGVRVEADTGLGGVGAPGFRRQGDVFTNDAYGNTDVTLNLKLKVGIGGVELKLVD